MSSNSGGPAGSSEVRATSIGRAGFEILWVQSVFSLASCAVQLWQDATAEAHERATAGARVPHRSDAIAGAIADRRLPPAPQIREHQLALAAGADRRAARRIEDFDDELALDQVHAVAGFARETGRSDL